MTDILARQRAIVGTSADWAAHDITLGDGELAIERASGVVRAKVGNGLLPFSAAPYLGEAAPAAFNYLGNADVTAPPPPGASAGDFITAAADGTIAASWGAPAAGTVVEAGQMIALDVDGEWNVQAQVIDLSALVRKDDLGAPDGASDVGWQQSGPDTVPRTTESKLRESVSVADFGAVGDGVADDTAAIQKAINACAGQNGRTVHFPAGNYYISAPITVPNYTHITGEGPNKSRINLQGKPYASHIFTHADPNTWGWLTIENFAFRGGSTALLNQSASQENWTLTNVGFEIQTIAGIQTGDWQINRLTNCVFYYCGEGIRTNGFANLNNYIGCEFDGLARQAIRHDGSGEVANFIGCRFEGGGADQSTFELYNSRNINFYGCYFEGTHIRVLNLFSGSGILFDACHFTYPSSPTVTNPQYEFNSAVPVQFGTNTWGRKSDGSALMRVTGNNGLQLGKNNKIYRHTSRQAQDLVNTSVALATGSNTVPTVRVAREYTANTLADSSVIYGELRVLVFQMTTGGFGAVKAVKIPVAVGISGAGAFGATFGTQVVDVDTSSATITISPALASDTINLTIAGIAASLGAGFATWEWRSFAGAQPGYYAITAEFASVVAADPEQSEEARPERHWPFPAPGAD